MNSIEFTGALLNKFKSFEAGQSESDLTQTGKILTCTRELLKELRQFIAGYQFENREEETLFFKTSKPVLLSQYYYHKRKFALQLFDAFRDPMSRIENYNLTLRKMQSYVQKNKEFFAYCMSGGSYMDTSYFVRNSNSLSINRDDQFSTGFDIKLAKFLAIEISKADIMERIQQLQDKENSNRPGLSWTAQKIDLVELIYSLQSLGAFNNASLEIKDIVASFEQMFNVNLGNYYRVFLGLKMRKNSQTLFLDRMKEKLTQRINDADEH